jgi:hypothetical protein
MKSSVIDNSKAKKNQTISPVQSSENEQKANGLPLSTQFDDSTESQKEGKALPDEILHFEKNNSTTQRQENEDDKVNPEPTKKEIKANIAERIAEQQAILQRHIKLGDELSRKIKHRDNLKTIITTLDEFELALKDSADETDGNYFQGCLLTIKDDNGKTFTTKNPTIIRGVAEQVNSLCSEKLEEVEMDIVNLIPA